MKYNLYLLPEVEEDALGAYKWYEDKVSGLGNDFLKTFYTSIDSIQSNPKLYPTIYKDYRRCLMNRFPYIIYYKLEENEIIVFALFHGARNPHTIHKQIKGRN